MEHNLINKRKDSRGKEETLRSLSKDLELVEDSSLVFSESKFGRLIRRVKPKHALILNVKQLQDRGSCIQESFHQRTRSLNNSIPKHIVCLDEKYLRRCLELIHINAAKAASRNISVNLCSSKMDILAENFNSPNFRGRSTCDLARFVVECPLAAGTGNIVINPAGQWILGTITGSKSMINILKSPLFRQCGTLDGNANFGSSSSDVKGPVCFDSMSSPGMLSISSSPKLQKKTAALGHNRYRSKLDHKRRISMSSTDSSHSDLSSTSSFSLATTSQGMLQCSWKGGIPRYVFSVDDQREIFVANLCKVQSPDNKALDYIYLFHLRMNGQKEHEAHNNEAELVGKMKVSTSFTLCPNNSKIMETEFVLFGATGNYEGGMQTSNHNLGKSKGFSKKVVKALRFSHTSKNRTISSFGGTSTILENNSWEPCQDMSNDLNELGSSGLLESDLPPNLELAAIVVKDHLHDNHRKPEVGGWGLKFLKNVGVKQNNACLEASISSGCCLRSSTTSMDILVPASFHGGPRTRNGGPSSLTERWRTGGCCDCGGWDIGCPLTVLNTRSRKELPLPQADAEGECKSIDLFVQGSKQSIPTFKMVNIRDDLHFIHFQSTLSALQSFSIAVAISHTRSPTLRPKNIQQLK